MKITMRPLHLRAEDALSDIDGEEGCMDESPVKEMVSHCMQWSYRLLAGSICVLLSDTSQ